MEKSRKERFWAAMKALGETFDREITEGKLDAYSFALKDLPIEEIEKGTLEVMRTRKTASFPKPGEIREASQGNIELEAIMAFEVVEKAIRKYGAYQSVVFDDPVISRTIANLGGWVKMCRTPIEEAKWIKKDFLRLYDAFSSRGVEAVLLIGILDSTNGTYKPVYIGDKYKCLEQAGKPKGAQLDILTIAKQKRF